MKNAFDSWPLSLNGSYSRAQGRATGPGRERRPGFSGHVIQALYGRNLLRKHQAYPGRRLGLRPALCPGLSNLSPSDIYDWRRKSSSTAPLALVALITPKHVPTICRVYGRRGPRVMSFSIVLVTDGITLLSANSTSTWRSMSGLSTQRLVPLG